MNRIVIDRLIVRSQTREDAVVEFTQGLNVVTGPSDSGKSYVLDLLDFIFGASKLRRVIPEVEPYDYVIAHLSFVGEDPHRVSLARPTKGGAFEIREGHVQTVGVADQPRYLSPIHNANNLDNLSNYLLDQIGLAGSKLRKNRQNQTRTLSFRDLAHLSLVNETSMQASISPITPTGQHTNRTAEESVFSLLLEGEDDSDLSETPPTAEEKRLSDTRTRLLDSVIAALEDQSPSAASVIELRSQLDRLDASIASETESMAARVAERDQVASQRSTVTDEIARTTSELGELTDLYNRFLLLSRQYSSDLERLDMVGEAGTLLALSNPDVCVLCGAGTEHQHWDVHNVNELTSLTTAVDVEKRKIQTLAEDLNQTLQDVRRRGRSARSRLVDLRTASDRLASQLRQLDSSLRPDRAQLRELLDKRSSVERAVTVQEHIEAVDALRAQVAATEQEAAGAARERPSTSALSEFCSIVQSALQAWHVQGSSSVRYDRVARDLVVGGRLRASRGKGVRALQHAAFSVALVRYCAARDLPNPGFLVLDSPLVTYREPDSDDPVWDDPRNIQSTSEAFYADLSQSDGLQIIVIENIPPPPTLSVEVNEIAFTLNAESGRYGLFPRQTTH